MRLATANGSIVKSAVVEGTDARAELQRRWLKLSSAVCEMNRAQTPQHCDDVIHGCDDLRLFAENLKRRTGLT